jgi:hypothetical protein
MVCLLWPDSYGGWVSVLARTPPALRAAFSERWFPLVVQAISDPGRGLAHRECAHRPM